MDALTRYNILASFDRAKIQAELGETYANMGEVHAAFSAAYQHLSCEERADDAKAAESALSAMASKLGRKGGIARSEKKTAASRENGRRGGRPTEREHRGVAVRYTGPGEYWATSPDRQGSLSLGACASLDEVTASIDAMIDAGSGDEDWTGWTVSK